MSRVSAGGSTVPCACYSISDASLRDCSYLERQVCAVELRWRQIWIAETRLLWRAFRMLGLDLLGHFGH